MTRTFEHTSRNTGQLPIQEDNYSALSRFVQTTLPQKLRRQTDAEDILQETFMEAWQYNDAPSAPTKSIVWLRTVAKRKIIDCVRRRAARKRASDVAEPKQIERRALATPEPAPSTCLEKREAERILAEALEALSARHRKAIRLRFFEQMAFSDVAKELGISRKAAQMLVKRATVQLRRIIGRQSRVI